MQIIIDIPDRIYYGVKNSITVNGSDASQMLIDAVKNGTPLEEHCDSCVFYHEESEEQYEDSN